MFCFTNYSTNEYFISSFSDKIFKKVRGNYFSIFYLLLLMYCGIYMCNLTFNDMLKPISIIKCTVQPLTLPNFCMTLKPYIYIELIN